MLSRVLFLMLLMMVVGNIQAQSNAKSYKVNFNVNEFILDKQDQSILSQVVNQSKSVPYAEVTLSAHTDNDANDNYNLILSKKRAESVKLFLIKKGIPANRIIMDCYGENKPILTNDNMANKSANRRVEITVETFKFNNVNQMLKAAGGNYMQTFTVNPTQPNTIKGKNGTSIFIPAHTLVDANNKPVSVPVTIKLAEFLNLGDALFQSLSTQTIDGKQLETGGMFKVEAFANNQPLQLKKGAAMQVAIPANAVKEDMEVFTGVTNTAGVMQWQSTGKSFVSNKVAKVQNHNMDNMRFYFKVPPAPRAPIIKNKPVLGVALSEKRVLPFWSRLLLTKKQKNDRMEQHRKAIAEQNKMLLQAYRKELNKYKIKYAKYQADSANYVNMYGASFNNWVNQQIKLQQVFLQYIKGNYKDSIGMENLILVGEENNILSRYDLVYLESQMHANRYHHLVDKHVKILMNLEQMKSTGVVVAYEKHGWRDYISCIDAYEKRKSVALTPAIQQVTVAEITTMREILQARNPTLTDADVANAEQELTYTAYIESMGTINCDRFTNTPSDQFVYITIPNVTEAQVAFYIASQKSFLYATKTANGYQVRIPKKTDYTLFVMSLEKSQPMFYTQTGKAETPQTINASLQAITMAQLKQAFNAL